MAACFLDGLFVEQIMSAGFVFVFFLFCIVLVWFFLTLATGIL